MSTEKPRVCSLSSLEQERLDRTFAALPTDIANGLEIGCYNFLVTDRLRARMDLVSIDLPRPVPAHQGYRLAFADIQGLPFRDRAFDLVFCTEVLEHLPADVLARGVKELQRVSRRCILVTVPYRQRVWNEMFKCAHCGFICNRMGHRLCFDESDLRRLFDSAVSVRTEVIGRAKGYAPDWLYNAANRLGGAWCDHIFGLCPNCGVTARAVKPNAFGYVLQRLIWRVEARAKPRPAWILVLFTVRT